MFQYGHDIYIIYYNNHDVILTQSYLYCISHVYVHVGPDCYTGSGRGYNGTVSVTESGHTCQVWTHPYPHQHYLFPYYYPELAGTVHVLDATLYLSPIFFTSLFFIFYFSSLIFLVFFSPLSFLSSLSCFLSSFIHLSVVR